MTDQEISSDDGFYDDAGRWWPNNAEWCDHCDCANFGQHSTVSVS